MIQQILLIRPDVLALVECCCLSSVSCLCTNLFFLNNFGESMANWAKYSWTTQCIDQFVNKVHTVDMAFNVNAYIGCLTTKNCFSSIESFTVDAWPQRTVSLVHSHLQWMLDHCFSSTVIYSGCLTTKNCFSVLLSTGWFQELIRV